jgi:mono/diheme cytochrome c family protein
VVVLAILLLIGWLIFRTVARFTTEQTAVYDQIEEHFKYGSIGSDNLKRGVPYWIWAVLPEMFPEYLPNGGKGGYAALGMITEPGKELPIGFSMRRTGGIEVVGLNCAVCHTSTIRASAEDEAQIVLGMPANTIDLEAYFRFLATSVTDGHFTADNVLAQIEQKTNLDFIDRYIYRQAVYAVREGVLVQAQQLSYWDRIPDFGPGRVDTFGPYQALYFGVDPGDKVVGTADFPSLWNQRPREGMELHWHGNNSSLQERNYSAAMGAGALPETLDTASLDRVVAWSMDLTPPPFPEERIDRTLAAQGEPIYQQQCAVCHAFDGERVGMVEPIEEIQTDSNRLDSFTDAVVANMNTFGTGYPWKFTHFKKTNGYANMPLDGVWLRAPYLHNGPTLLLIQRVRATATAVTPMARSFRPRRRMRCWSILKHSRTCITHDPPRAGNSNNAPS